MADRPIYAGNYPNRKRQRVRNVFIIVVLVHLCLGAYILFKPKAEPQADIPSAPQPASPEAIAPSASIPIADPAVPPPAGIQSQILDAQAAIDAGQWQQARTLLQRVIKQHPDPEAIKLLGQVNMHLLKSPLMMPEKEYYVIQSGDYLQKIAKKYNTTVALLKSMNNLTSDTIRLGDRMLVFKGNFSLIVSKGRNELDLMLNDQLFKRYSVGTGKFGKTPTASFTVVDKIVEPPWTRPSDGQQIEFGDPDNVLGTRWMAIKSEDHPELTGFGIHGTWENDSIGKQSSAGCIRMLNEEVEELFDLIPRKTSVLITD